MENKLSLTIDEAVEATGIGRTTLFALIRTGELKHMKIGRRTLIRVDDLKSFLASRVGASGAGVAEDIADDL